MNDNWPWKLLLSGWYFLGSKNSKVAICTEALVSGTLVVVIDAALT
jgi:hypothetical protein